MKTLGRVLVIAGLLVAPVAALAAPAADSASAPRDMSMGMAAGKRMHKPFTITKEWGSRSAAVADCTALHGSVSTDASGKLVCTGDVNGDGMADVCARASAMGAVCKP